MKMITSKVHRTKRENKTNTRNGTMGQTANGPLVIGHYAIFVYFAKSSI